MVPAVLVVPVVVVGCSGNSSLVQAQPTKIPCQVEQGRQLNVWKRGGNGGGGRCKGPCSGVGDQGGNAEHLVSNMRFLSREINKAKRDSRNGDSLQGTTNLLQACYKFITSLYTTS